MRNVKLSLNQKKWYVFAAGALVFIGALVQLVALAAPNKSVAADAVMTDFTISDASSDNVYQQQVTALWAIKDLLGVLADQSAGLAQLQTAVVALTGACLALIAFLVWLVASVNSADEPIFKKKQKSENVSGDS